MKKNTFIKLKLEDKQLISSDIAHHYKIIPKNENNNELILYTFKREIDEIQEELEVILGKKIKFEFISYEILERALFENYMNKENVIGNINIKDHLFLENLINEAQSLGSSDIHFEVFENYARIRIRIDGHLIERYKIEKSDYKELVNRIKIKSNLDITEKRLPQDGRINFGNFDLRVSILPTLYGEKIVLRILNKNTDDLNIENLGFNKEELQIYLESVKKSNGIVFISGPTGSGKTTTLYATLKVLNKNNRNILTVEDPIEYTLEGINQVQLKESIGLTFSSALRSFLRQDPDIIMLGEIRDTETAQMAIRASLTGHLVLSTIHTNSAIGSISRLVDMGIPAFLIAETLNLSVAQRLVRILCKSCKTTHEVDKELFPSDFEFPFEIDTISSAVGCPNCYYTGYSGRKAIYELLPVNSELVSILKKDYNNLDEFVKEQKNKTLAYKAFEMIANHETSLEEVYSLLLHH